jgi:hypothetical protein
MPIHQFVVAIRSLKHSSAASLSSCLFSRRVQQLTSGYQVCRFAHSQSNIARNFAVSCTRITHLQRKLNFCKKKKMLLQRSVRDETTAPNSVEIQNMNHSSFRHYDERKIDDSFMCTLSMHDACVAQPMVICRHFLQIKPDSNGTVKARYRVRKTVSGRSDCAVHSERIFLLPLCAERLKIFKRISA